ncbi:MAG TPA: RlmE family RNA methyltransferase [Polyangiaceae bacterium]
MSPKQNPYARPDRFTRAAKDAGFPARSVYKLEEIDRRTRLFRQGMHVLDLGATPGSWSLYAAQKIGRGGKLLAVDLEPLGTVLPPHAVFVQGDALLLAGADADAGAGVSPGTSVSGGELEEQLARFAPYDVVLSDMAPRTTGNRVTDQTRSFELFMRALAVGARLGKAGGAFVGKIFMSDDLPAARAELRKHYASERLIRPEGTRAVSTELFVVGQGKRA